MPKALQWVAKVFPGNTNDSTTVIDKIAASPQSYGLEKIIFVGHRGMITEARLEELRDVEGLNATAPSSRRRFPLEKCAPTMTTRENTRVSTIMVRLPKLLAPIGLLVPLTSGAESVSYYKEIRPILQAHCQGCHQPAKAKGGYVMTSFELLLEGGETDVAIVPGEPQSSHLIEMITPVDGKAEMPRDKPPLAAQDIALITQWISQGAKDDTPANAKQRYTQDNPPIYTRPPVITSLDFSPDGKWLAIAGFHEVLLHHADGSGLAARLVGLSERIESLAFSPDGQYLAVSGGLPARMGEVQVWEMETRKLTMSIPVTYDTVYGVSWSPEGDRIAFGCSDSTVRAIDAHTGEEVLYQGSHDDWVFDTVFSVKGTHLASVGRDMTAKLIELATQRFVDNITSITPKALKGGIASVDRHPLRDEILVGGADGVPKIYKMFRTTKRVIGDDANLLQELPALEGRVFSVSFSRDARRIAAGSSLDGRGEVKVFGVDPEAKIAEGIRKILEKPTHQRNHEEKKKLQAYYDTSAETLASLQLDTPIYAVAFSPDGDTVAASGGDGVIRLLTAEGGAIQKEFVPVKVRRHRDEEVAALQVEPEEIRLSNPHAYSQLVVTAHLGNGDATDVTREIDLADQKLVAISANGLVRGAADGAGSLGLSYAGQSLELPVKVSGMATEFLPDYVRDVSPLVAKTGCNAGTCHGAKDGKNGFKLSLRGYDPVHDLRAFTDDIAARRVNVAAPDSSLILLKATAGVPHEGGQVVKPGDHAYQIIRNWIADGAKINFASKKAIKIDLYPVNPVIQGINEQQQVRVLATYPDGSQRDVTHESFAESGNIEIIEVDEAGLITTLRRGESAILVRYEGKYASTIVTVMGDRAGFVWEEPDAYNEIDQLVAAKLKRTKTLSSGICTDADFVRRLHLDLTGLPPSVEAVTAFLADSRDSRTKRNALIDELIGSEPYIDLWSNKWADLLQVNRKFLAPEGAKLFRDWIRQEVADNTPYDQFVKKIITASGSNKENPASSYFKILRTPEDTMENTTHLFLGVRFNCNKCHDHPFERWTQDNYYEMAAYFGQVGLKADPASGDKKIGGTAVEGGKPLYEVVYDKEQGEVIHERTMEVTAPRFPYDDTIMAKEGATRRERLAHWMTSHDNRYFATGYVNRIWGYLTGTGLIEPLDDIRAGNPPTNPELLAWLTDQFIQSHFNTRELIRLICQSRTYQLSIETNKWNQDDEINFSHAKARRLPAEVLYDAVYAVTGAESNIPGVPAGTRAAQLPDAGVKLADGFLGNLGRPARESACECERSSELQLGPIMAMVSGPTVNDAISAPGNAIAKLAEEQTDPHTLVQSLFLRILNRPATEKEITLSQSAFDVIEGEHEEVLQALAVYEQQTAEAVAQRTKAREDRIAAAKKTLADYKVELVGIEAKRDEQQKAKVAKIAGDLTAHEEKLRSTLDTWEESHKETTGWMTLHPSQLSTNNGALLRHQPDGSIVASGKNDKVTYNLIAQTDLPAITGIRIEALPDDSLRNRGPGRADDGNFVLTEFEVTAAAAADNSQWEPLHTWDFQADAGGWEATNQAKIETSDGQLIIESQGNDPHLTHKAVSSEAGPFIFEIAAKFAGNLNAELFWMTAKEKEAKGKFSRKATLTGSEDSWSMHRFAFSSKEALTSLRLDPGNAKGKIHIDHITLYRGELPQQKTVALHNAKADFSQDKYPVAEAIDGKRDGNENGWAVSPQFGRTHIATFEFKEPVGDLSGTQFALQLDQVFNGKKFGLGRFRISVTNDPHPHHLGLPEAVFVILQTPRADRSEAAAFTLFDHVRLNDEDWRKLSDSLAKAKEPRPKDAKLIELEQALVTAEKPLPKDPKLEELKRAVALSTEQKKNTRLTGAQDIAWALINSPAFLFNR